MARKIIGLFKGKKKAEPAAAPAAKKGPIITQLGTVNMPEEVRRRIARARGGASPGLGGLGGTLGG